MILNTMDSDDRRPPWQTRQPIRRFDRTRTRTAHRRVISANAAKVLETTRRAWQTHALHAPAENKRAAKTQSSKKRVSPRRSQWGNLVAALNYWSPKPL